VLFKPHPGDKFPAMANLIFGCGYLGRRVAKLWRLQGQEVVAVTRSPAKAETFRQEGITPLVADLTQPATLASIGELAGIDTILFAVGYDRTAKVPLREVYVDGLAAVLQALPPAIGRFIYISSTGVYGQGSGDWVDENSACQPTREGGQACLAAEQLLVKSPVAAQTVALRLAGIYGPDRIPRAKDLQAGAAIPAPSQGYLNLIHVDDAARIVLLAEQRATPPKLYCVSDGHPALRSEYYAELARLLNAPPPKFIDPPGDSPAAQRASGDKRVANARLLADLQPELLYPSFREGLAAIVRDTVH
jgi:nucleoside-diphosphate-sugar epimerase